MIKIENLNFKYPDLTIFKDANLTINKGEFVSIIGANGSGKSTLMNLLLGFKEKDDGTISILGEDPLHFTQYSKIGYISQSGLTHSQGFPATALEVVMLKNRKMNKKSKEEALYSLEHVGLFGIEHKKISELSGGQLQRVYIARELMCDPEILFLDEPTSGLDSAASKSLMEVLHHLNEVHDMTVVMVTHHSAELSNRIIEVKNGQLIEMRRDDVRI